MCFLQLGLFFYHIIFLTHTGIVHIQMADTLNECFGSSITQYLSEKEEASAPAHSCTLTMQQMILKLREFFFHHLLQLRCNSHTVSVVEVEVGGGRAGPVSGAEKIQKKDEREEVEEGGRVESTMELKLGSALYPTASHFNHSCWPNVFFRCESNVQLGVMLFTF